MIQFNNFVGTNPNIVVTDQKGCFQIIEHQSDLSVSPAEAEIKYFMKQMNCKVRQLMFTLNGQNSVKLAAGAMQMMIGNVQMQSGINGVGGFVGGIIKSKATGDTAVKPIYSGVGYVLTEPSYEHFLLEDLVSWGGSLVCEDGMFVACDANIQDNVIMRSNLSSAVAGNEGLFNLNLQGQGTIVLKSKSPRNELYEIYLENDIVKIDGNNAVCWSGGLQFTVEKATNTIVGSALSGEGLVNVYRGTGKILVCQ